MMDIEFGIPQIDKRFIFKSNKRDLFKESLSKDGILETIGKCPDFSFLIQPDQKVLGLSLPTSDEVYVEVHRIIRSFHELKAIVDFIFLFQKNINGLSQF